MPQHIICMSSTHIAMLNAIGEDRCVIGVSGIDYVSNPDIQARRDSIGDVGYEGNINYELLLSLDPDLVLLYGVNRTSRWRDNFKNWTSRSCMLAIPGRVSVGQSRMAGGISGGYRETREGQESVCPDIPIRYNALKKRVTGAAIDARSVMLNTLYGD